MYECVKLYIHVEGFPTHGMQRELGAQSKILLAATNKLAKNINTRRTDIVILAQK